MRQTAWAKIGVSRATWYRRGKPTEKPRKKTTAEAAKFLGVSSTRTYYRMMRALSSELAPFVVSGQLSAAQADRLLGNSERLRRFLMLVERLNAAPAPATLNVKEVEA